MQLPQIHGFIDVLCDEKTEVGRTNLVQLETFLLNLMKTPQAVGIIALLLKEKSELNPSGFEVINSGITDEHFPITPEFSLKGFEFEVYDRLVSSAFVLDDLATRKRRAATPAEALVYLYLHPEIQKFWIGVIGQVWVDSDGDEVVVVLFEDAGRRGASLRRIADDWAARFQFLSLPL